MNIQEALDMADAMKPNMMEREVKIRFLQELDGMIHDEIVMRHEHTAEEETAPAYDSDTPGDTQLIIPAPYDMFYIYWLMSKIDLLNMEMDKYNNDRALFEDAWNNFGDYWTREHMPLTARTHFRI